MNVQLTGGAIEGIMTDQQLEKPVLQVLGQKKIAGSGAGADRYRLLLSDGDHSHSSAMLATQLNGMVTSGELNNFAVIQLDKYMCNVIQPDRRVMILLDISVLHSGADIGGKLGNPQPFKPGAGGGAPPTQPTQQQQQPQRPLVNGHGNSNGTAQAPRMNTTGSHASPAANQNRGAAGGGASGFYGGGAAKNKPFTVQDVPKTPGGTPAKVHPISSLTPYQNRWTIRARVTQKADIKTWSNSRGEGKLFSMTFLDESGEIRATAFNKEVDKYFEMIELNKVYYVSRASLKTANKQYSSVNNDYEMSFHSDTQITPCEEECDLPTLSFNFIPINEMGQQSANTTLDVIGIVRHAEDLRTMNSKTTGKEIKKRDLQLVDSSQVQIRMTLWGSDAEKFDSSSSPVMAVKNCRVSEWGGRSLSALQSSQIVFDPDIPEAHKLRGWFDNVGHSLDYEEYRGEGGAGGSSGGSGTNWKTFGEIKSQNIGQDKADYFTTKATIVFIRKENCMYMACPSESCNKKLVDQGNGQYRCEKCQKEYPNFKWRLILSANLAEFSDNQWVTCFQDSAESILNKAGDELGALKENDEVAFDQVFSEANFKSYIFRMRAKMETYNDESRLKTVVVGATPIDWTEYNKKLIGDIETLLQS